MRIVFNNAQYNKALKSYFASADFEFCSVCAINEKGAILGGCGFSPVKNNTTYVYILALNPKWASIELYKEIMKFPFITMNADIVLAVVHNKAAINIGLRMGGTITNDGHGLIFEKDAVLAKLNNL